MGRLEKVGAAVVGVLLCIIIVVGLVNKNGGQKLPPDASREANAITPAGTGRDSADNGTKVKPGPDEDLRDLLKRKDEEEAAERARLAAEKDVQAGKNVAKGPGTGEIAPILPKPGPDVVKTPVVGEWPKEYEIKSGDILGKICRTTYGSSSMVEAVKAANPGLDPRKLRPGTKISLPAPKVAVDAAKQPSGTTQAGTTVASRGNRPSFITPRHIQDNTGGEKLVSAQGGRTYTVKKGDSLSTIAQREMGSVKHIQALVEANKGLIASTRSTLQVGWELAIPNLN